MRRLLALTWKEFLHLKRDPLTIRMIVLVPLMQTIIFGYAINYDVKHLRTVVLDESSSYESRELVARMTASEYFEDVAANEKAPPELRYRAALSRGERGQARSNRNGNGFDSSTMSLRYRVRARQEQKMVAVTLASCELSTMIKG